MTPPRSKGFVRMPGHEFEAILLALLAGVAIKLKVFGNGP